MFCGSVGTIARLPASCPSNQRSMTSYLGVNADWFVMQLEAYIETHNSIQMFVRLFSSIVHFHGVITQIILVD